MNEFGLAFLDTFVYKEDGVLTARVCHKSTDNSTCFTLHGTQCRIEVQFHMHSLLVRAKSKETEFETKATNIINSLRRRKYAERILHQAMERITDINRDELLKPREKKEDTRIRYIITYNNICEGYHATTHTPIDRKEKKPNHTQTCTDSLQKIQKSV